ncbi:MAG: hypothetical protein COA62_15880 [Rhodobiaceae bacterium]|nr:MAG: hypothetical protein COA62_15880 [Rhodobiaceae bacterium]
MAAKFFAYTFVSLVLAVSFANFGTDWITEQSADAVTQRSFIAGVSLVATFFGLLESLPKRENS